MFKRVSSIVVTVAMLLTMLCTFSFASAAGEPLSLAVTSDAVDGLVTAGQTVVVTVRVENYSPMLAINVVGSYSADFFSNVAVKKTYKYQPLPDVAPDYWAEADCVKGSNMLQFVGNPHAGAGNEIKTIWADPYPIPTMDRVITVELTVANTVTPGSTTDLKLHIGPETEFEKGSSATYSSEDVTLTLKVNCEHEWVNPTWKEGTETHTYTCSKCHETRDEACGSFTENVVPPTCTADRYTEKTCGTCHHTYKEVEVGTAPGHTWVPDETTSGADGKHKCSVCGATESCSFGAGVRTPATCTEDAFTTYTCTICGRSYNVVEAGTAPGHTWAPDETTSGADGKHKCSVCGATENCTFGEGVRTPATCTEDAYTRYTCAHCGYSYDVVEEGTAGHQYGAWTHNAAATPDESAHARTCSVCGNVERVFCKDNLNTWTIQSSANCGEIATVEYSCSVCSAHYRVEGALVEHEWVNPTWKAETKTHTYTCSKCHKTKDEACGSFTENVVPPTCTADRYTEKTCGTCHHTYKEVEVGTATGHSWEYDNTTSGANAQHKCSVCGAAENCTFGEGVRTPATCTEDAFTTYTCTVCGYSYDVVEDGTAGHQYGAWVHSYDEETDSHTHSRTCSVCGDVETESCNLEVVAPTCVADGSISCSVCGFMEVIPGGDGEHTRVVMKYKAPTADEEGYIVNYCEACGTELSRETIEAGEPYDDLKAEDAAWYYDAAVFCNAFGFFVGEYGNFNGDDALTRGQAVTIIGRIFFPDEFINGMTDEEFEELLSNVDENVAVVELTDLKGSYYDRFAMMLVHMGIVKGYDDQTFRGDDLVTREELAAFLMRFLEWTESDISIGAAVSFRDMDQVSEWAKDIVIAAGSKGLFIGDEGNFNPKSNATRAEMAVLMERVMKAWFGFDIIV